MKHICDFTFESESKFTNLYTKVRDVFTPKVNTINDLIIQKENEDSPGVGDSSQYIHDLENSREEIQTRNIIDNYFKYFNFMEDHINHDIFDIAVKYTDGGDYLKHITKIYASLIIYYYRNTKKKEIDHTIFLNALKGCDNSNSFIEIVSFYKQIILETDIEYDPKFFDLAQRYSHDSKVKNYIINTKHEIIAKSRPITNKENYREFKSNKSVKTRRDSYVNRYMSGTNENLNHLISFDDF